MQSMAVKHSTRGWNLKKYAKRVLFKANSAVFWAPKEVVEPTTWVQDPLGSGDQRCLCIIQIGCAANGPLHPSMDILDDQKGAFFGHF